MSLHEVKIVSKSHHEAPSYQTTGASGMDIRAVLEAPLTLAPMQRALVPTGIYLEMDQSLECQVRPRSGLALKKGLTVLNTPGTIDADYRGEVGVILVNLSAEPVTITDGERIAQLVFCKVEKVNLIQVQTLSTSDRGEGGFGSTGVK
ncbi:MAG: dUTP diphosphatase [Flavobacteriia bacterium]|jgi:dUTP pyrophosphatase|nr:dUTP diphosphatase [Flavobacteriia bacterium]